MHIKMLQRRRKKKRLKRQEETRFSSTAKENTEIGDSLNEETSTSEDISTVPPRPKEGHLGSITQDSAGYNTR